MSPFLNSVKSFLEAHTAGVREKVEWYAFIMRHHLPRSVARKSAWAMGNRDLQAIFGVARRYQAKDHVNIVELGSGTSTIVLASVLPTLLEDPYVTSIEGEETYARHAQQMLRQYKLDRYASVCWVPYSVENDRVWFSRPALEQTLCEKRVDILIVDAPPGSLQPQARQPAIPFFLPFLDESSVVMLHDASRLEESLIAKEWKRFFRVYYQIPTPQGFAVFEKRY